MTVTSKGRKAALGVRCHSGWATVILVAGSREDIEIADRRRIELCDPDIHGSKQPFHEAEPMPFTRAEGFIARCRASTEALARGAIHDVVALAASRKLKLTACGVLSASGRALPPLRDILASHMLIHAAEGEFYRDAVARACERMRIPILRIRERDALRQACDAIVLSEVRIRNRLFEFRKTLGAPWTEDEKLATLAAWITLVN